MEDTYVAYINKQRTYTKMCIDRSYFNCTISICNRLFIFPRSMTYCLSYDIFSSLINYRRVLMLVYYFFLWTWQDDKRMKLNRRWCNHISLKVDDLVVTTICCLATWLVFLTVVFMLKSSNVVSDNAFSSVPLLLSYSRKSLRGYNTHKFLNGRCYLEHRRGKFTRSI